MSFLADFHAKTSAQMELVRASKENVLDYGPKWLESSVRFDLSSSVWKIHHDSEEKVLPWSSVILPKWGMAVNGFVYQHPMALRPIQEIASGLWPTVKSTIRSDCPSERLRHSPDLVSVIKTRPLPNGSTPPQDGSLNPEWVEWFMGWPIGWTELKPLAMDKFREWRQQHSPCSKQIEKSS